ncbi:hypothetical protein LOK49_LG02G01664 [Camellia lanceoleosa]|uniref:Uncharacterized protein n=1 Tax=Camellia lanceoleosa TaxID=1840588 RepID=A0ACC0IKR2_9ERIC|nr:hypothetical protein LOK49_LG02G01664 [Camellia lanceoleosa]
MTRPTLNKWYTGTHPDFSPQRLQKVELQILPESPKVSRSIGFALWICALLSLLGRSEHCSGEKKLESKNVAVEKWWRSLLKPSKKSFIGQCQRNMKEGNIRGGKRRLEELQDNGNMHGARVVELVTEENIHLHGHHHPSPSWRPDLEMRGVMHLNNFNGILAMNDMAQAKTPTLHKDDKSEEH